MLRETFVIYQPDLTDMYPLSGGKIANAIGESVKPRYNGHPSHVKDLEKLIIDGVNKKEKGLPLKGTVFGFDCSSIGVQVLVNGSSQGTVRHGGLGKAFVDVFTGADAVSPALVESCMQWGESVVAHPT